MEEYEYSYYVKDINPYIEFCEKNNYKKISEVSQHRKVFENQYNRLTYHKDLFISPLFHLL